MKPTAFIPLGEVTLDAANGCGVRSGDGESTVVLRLADIDVDGTIATDGLRRVGLTAEQREKYAVQTGDLLVFRVHGNRRVTGSAVAYAGPSGFAYCDHFIRLRLDRTRVDPKYLARAFASPQVRAQIDARIVSTAGQNTISQGALLPVLVPVPSLPEQRRIADILDKADAIRRKCREAIALTEELLRSVFLEMFGDPVTNTKGWPMTTLGDEAVEMKYGTSAKCGPPSPGALPVLRIPNIVGGVVDWSDLKFAALDDRERTSLTLRSKDILFVRSNGNPDYIGRCAVFDSDRTALFASYLIRVRLRDGGLHPSYVRAALSSASYRSRLTAEARTTAGNYNISTEGLRRLRLAVPPLPLQQRFVEFERVASRTQQRLMAQLADSDALFRSLVQRVFPTT